MLEQTDAPLPTEIAVLLQQNLVAHFADNELEQLCFELGVTYADLDGKTRSDKARAVVQYFERRNEVAKLLVACAGARPLVTWPNLPVVLPTPMPFAPVPLVSIPELPGVRPPNLVLQEKKQRLKNWKRVISVSMGVLLVVLSAIAIRTAVMSRLPSAPIVDLKIFELGGIQFSDGHSNDRDQPNADAALKIQTLPLINGKAIPSSSIDAVWILACQLDIAVAKDECRATRMPVSTNTGDWGGVLRMFDGTAMCHKFEVLVWVIDPRNDGDLSTMVAEPVSRERVGKITPRSQQAYSIYVDQANELEQQCGANALAGPAA